MEGLYMGKAGAAHSEGKGEGPRKHRHLQAQTMRELLSNPEMLAALGSGVLMLAAWAAGSWSELLSIVLYVASYMLGGWSKAKEGIETLIKKRDLDVNLLMIAAAVGAASIGYWNEGAMLIFIFAMSGALESYSMQRSRRDISSLMQLQPETALRVEGGATVTVSVDQLNIGDMILVKPGELIPADGRVYRGSSSVDQASITGESVPVDKVEGDEVFAGTLNGEGALYVEVTEAVESMVFSKIVKLVEAAENEVPESERFIKRFESAYTKIVVGVTAGIIVIAPMLGWDWDTSFYKAMVFLVVASPCALVASIMPAMLSAISSRARKGVLFKGGVHMENIAYTAVAAFDKTGTLTMGRPEVTDLIAGSGLDRTELLGICASVESMSKHPLAQAVVRKAEEEGVQLLPADNGQSITGWGVQAEIGGKLWRIGKSSVLDEQDSFGVQGDQASEDWHALRDRFESEGKTVSVIVEGDRIRGMFAIQDTVRPQAAAAVKRLHSMGIQVAMLTGDRSKVAEVIAEKIGVDLVYSDLLPGDKVRHLKSLRETYGHVIMIGDGVNDAPALATATVGISMGITGSGTAIEVADAVLMNDNIEEIADTIRVARRARRIVKQNMIFSCAVILTLIAANFTSGIALPLGVIGHEGSTILVILNGLRLLKE